MSVLLPERIAFLVGKHPWLEQLREELPSVLCIWIPTLHDLLFELDLLLVVPNYEDRCRSTKRNPRCCPFLVVTGSGYGELEDGEGLKVLCERLKSSQITLELLPETRSSCADGFCNLVSASGIAVTQANSCTCAASLARGALGLSELAPSPSHP